LRKRLRCPLTELPFAGAFPTHSLRNLQRLYGLLPGINVAVKVPPRGVKKPIRVLGVFGDTIARMTRKARARELAHCAGSALTSIAGHSRMRRRLCSHP
jgi:hypothetical protein